MLIESDCTQLCKYIHIRCEVRTPSVRKERCELRQVSMLPAIFLLCDITIVFSQLNNCLPKRFLCEKRSRQTLIVRVVVPSRDTPVSVVGQQSVSAPTEFGNRVGGRTSYSRTVPRLPCQLWSSLRRASQKAAVSGERRLCFRSADQIRVS